MLTVTALGNRLVFLSLSIVVAVCKLKCSSIFALKASCRWKKFCICFKISPEDSPPSIHAGGRVALLSSRRLLSSLLRLDHGVSSVEFVSKGRRPDRDPPLPEFDPTLDPGVSLRISRPFSLCAGLDTGVSLNGETDAGVLVCVESGEWELEGDDEVVLRGTGEWGVLTTGPLLLALALFDEDERFVSCCLRLLCLFGASLAISVDIPALVHN